MTRRYLSRCRLISPAMLSLLTLATARPARASVDAVVSGLVEDALLHPLAGATVALHAPRTNGREDQASS